MAVAGTLLRIGAERRLLAESAGADRILAAMQARLVAAPESERSAVVECIGSLRKFRESVEGHEGDPEATLRALFVRMMWDTRAVYWMLRKAVLGDSPLAVPPGALTQGLLKAG